MIVRPRIFIYDCLDKSMGLVVAPYLEIIIIQRH